MDGWIGKRSTYTHRVLFSHEEECHLVICRKMGRIGEHHVTLKKPDSQEQIPCVSLICEVLKKTIKDAMQVEGRPLEERRASGEGGPKYVSHMYEFANMKSIILNNQYALKRD